VSPVRGIASAAVLAVAVGVAAACGGGGDSTKASANVPLTQRVLNESELPSDYDAHLAVQKATAADLLEDVDPLFEPNTLQKRLEHAGFKRGVLEQIEGPTKPTKTQAGAGGTSEVALLGSPAGAVAQISFLRERALAPCLTVCEISRKSFDVPGIPGAAGVERYQDENTANGPAFELYYVFFSAGRYLYTEALSGPPDELSADDIVSASQSLYGRVTD
jgi:hypothetical protein